MKTAQYRMNNIEQVLYKTLELCEEKGISAVNNTNIAAAVGLSTKSIQRYFVDKPDMIMQVAKMLIQREETELNKLLDAQHLEEKTGREELEAILCTYNNFFIHSYKDVVFLNNAFVYCRYEAEKGNSQWKEIQKEELFVTKIKNACKKGFEDTSLNEEKWDDISIEMDCTSYRGLIVQLADDIDSGIVSLEHALKIVDAWKTRCMIHYEK